MSSKVFGEVVCPGKALPTHLTMVWTLTRVDPQVASKVTLSPKRPPTEETSEWSLPCVFPHMELKVLLRSDTFPTERTSKGPGRTLPLCPEPQEAEEGALS